MFQILLVILIIIYVYFMLKYINQFKKYKEFSELKYIDNIQLIDKESYDPVVIKYTFNDVSINNLIVENDKYYCIDGDNCIRMSDLNTKGAIYKNKDIFLKLKNEDNISKILDNFKTNISFYNNNYGSIIKGLFTTEINKNNNNLLLLSIIYGKCNVYLFNPKHNDLKNKELNDIRKLSININLNKNDILYIPSNWYYIIEVMDECIFINSEQDTYFTFMYNLIRI